MDRLCSAAGSPCGTYFVSFCLLRAPFFVDVTNACGVPPEKLGGQPSAKFVAQAFIGGKLVKGFNHLAAAILNQDPAVHGGRRVVFLASDDDGAAAEIGALAENIGFSPIKLGGLRQSKNQLSQVVISTKIPIPSFSCPFFLRHQRPQSFRPPDPLFPMSFFFLIGTTITSAPPRNHTKTI
jgi:hypothetical protein